MSYTRGHSVQKLFDKLRMYLGTRSIVGRLSHQEGFVVDTQDLRGMSNQQADEYLFGRYEDAKRRWRRFTGKPVRRLRTVFRRTLISVKP